MFDMCHAAAKLRKHYLNMNVILNRLNIFSLFCCITLYYIWLTRSHISVGTAHFAHFAKIINNLKTEDKERKRIELAQTILIEICFLILISGAEQAPICYLNQRCPSLLAYMFHFACINELNEKCPFLFASGNTEAWKHVPRSRGIG